MRPTPRLLWLTFALALLSCGTFTNKTKRGDAATRTDDWLPASPLHRAAAEGDRALLERLIAEGAPIDATDRYHWTPLFFAVLRDRAETAKLLLEHGADPNARAHLGMTPLHWAAMKGSADMIVLLTARGARTDTRSAYGRTPLHDVGDYRAAEALLRAGAEVDAIDGRGMTPLQTARDGLVAKAVLRANADPRIRNSEGLVALQIAVVESLEPQGLSVQARQAPLRLRSTLGTGAFTVRSITDRHFVDLAVSATSPACSVVVLPVRVDRLEPGEIVDYQVTLARTPGVPEGVHFVHFQITQQHGKEVGRFELKVDTTTSETPEDQGRIVLSQATLRKTPSRIYYSVYAVVPLVVGVAWLLSRRRAHKGGPRSGS